MFAYVLFLSSTSSYGSVKLLNQSIFDSYSHIKTDMFLWLRYKLT